MVPRKPKPDPLPSLQALLQERVQNIRLIDLKLSLDADVLVQDDEEKRHAYHIELTRPTRNDEAMISIASCEVTRALEGRLDVAFVAKYFTSIDAKGLDPTSTKSVLEEVTRFAVWPLFRACFEKTLRDAQLDLPYLPLYPTVHWEEDDPGTIGKEAGASEES